jgi:lipopolysaccharide/colanic/teichoic acid biosynthesis glycosyltransferase
MLGRPAPGYKPFGRVFDVTVSAMVLALTWPVLALAALAIKVTSAGPVFFRQTRVGLHGRPFTILKLRTMTFENDDSAYRELCRRELQEPDADAGTEDGIFKLENDPRITSVGRLLRRFSVDEIPQLINVLRGDMALVGPRPLAPFELAMQSPYHAQRARVRPGLTGYWQVSGRNKISARAMLDLDVEYVRQRSWSFDFAVLAHTPAAVLRGDGVR